LRNFKKRRYIILGILLILFLINIAVIFNSGKNRVEFDSKEDLKLSGAYWVTTEVVSTESTGNSYEPPIVVDGDGNAHVVWHDYTNYNSSGTDADIFYKLWNATSSTWTTTEVVSTESTGDSGLPTIAVDGTGNVHVAWQDVTNYNSSGTDYDIFYKRWNTTSSTWTTTEVISTESTGISYEPTIAMDSIGNAHVAWHDYTNYNSSGVDPDIFYKLWDATSSTWTKTEVVSTESTGSSGLPTIAVDGTGNVHLVWQDNTNYNSSGTDYDIFYKRWTAASSTWTTTEVISTESTGDSYEPTISVDNIGNAHMAWHDFTNYNSSGTDPDIFYKRMNPFPEITIYSPDQNAFFGIVAPNFNIHVIISNLDTLWYTLDDGLNNITFSGLTGIVDQFEWDKILADSLTIRFYANDTFGFEGYAEVVIKKDLNPPQSSISHEGLTFTITADDGLGSGVSVIKYKINGSAWIDYTVPFGLDYGNYNITHQAIDVVGNVEAEGTLIISLKEPPIEEDSPGIPGYSPLIIMSAVLIAVAIFIISFQRKNQKYHKF